ncbi:MAG: Rne/Rng family ribonuclease [Pyrinomonadaceae bacterium]
MSKEMIVSVNGREKKIAILDNGRVTEFYIERGEENSGVVGNVYKGRVMRVLPGMQSAFVDIGLERDAFLYVSDFFDEEEEIERIVMEKGKKTSPEEAKREANDQIERSRAEREKQMEAVQEIAEPMAETPQQQADENLSDAYERVEEPEEEEVSAPVEPEARPKRGRGRGRKEQVEIIDEPMADADNQWDVEAREPVEVDFDNSGFERISDDGEPGESFKDAYVQEAIIDRVRAVEFDMESTAEAEVGSLFSEVATDVGGFERIADEEDETPAPKKPRGKGKPADGEDAVAAKPKVPRKRAAGAKGKFSKTSKAKKTKTDGLEDTEASHRESPDSAEMAVRRGGRGRRRGGKKEDEGVEEGLESVDGESAVETAVDTDDPVEAMSEGPGDAQEQQTPPETTTEEPAPAGEDRGSGRERTDGRDRSRRAPRGRDDRPREERPREDRPRDDRPREDRPREDRPREDRPRNDRPREERPRDDRPRGDRPGGDNKRPDRNDRGRDRGPQPTISDLLREGQEILVQIAKEPIAKKGARITSHIALPGRYLVYMPTIEHLGVSRKIESATERSRLRQTIQRIRQDAEIPSGGFIVRTAGIGVPEEDLRNDAKYLARMWVDSKKGSEKKKSPALVHQDLDLVQRILRDQLADDFTAIRVDSEEEYLRTVEFINLIQPRLVKRIKLYTRDEPILDYYGVQEEIDKALKPRVWLKSGGYLVINQTEALIAVDVNTGKFVGKGNARLEDTITRTNMEAVDEIARQIRLRDLGGIIVLDLIDMEDRRNRNKVAQALQEALASDRSPNKVLSFNDFGLIIMTRKRVKQSLERTMCAPCDYCEGAGWVKSPITVCYEILAEARRLSKNVEDVRHTTVRVHPDVAQALRGSEFEVLEEIESYLGAVDVTSDKSVHQGQFDFAFV